jgi:hypothetical protein
VGKAASKLGNKMHLGVDASFEVQRDGKVAFNVYLHLLVHF